MQIRYCLSCNKELLGRTDKKFCDTQCRSTHHNKNRPFHEITIQKANSGLRRNRTLLAHFCPSGKSTVRKDVLVELDYRFELFTYLFPFKKGTYYFCYDYGFLPIEEKGIKKMLIVQKQDYMENLSFNPWGFKL
ncbi:MAG: hypothetical protein IIB06_06770 [Bacteroidetes bacterium]|nr:hypothetical protein [Bacteroidota bacterium]